MSRCDPPSNVKDLGVSTDAELLPEEKELRIICPNDRDYCHVSTEIPTFIKWIQSVEESDFEWVRLDHEGSIVACSAVIPKGLMMMKGKPRQSNRHSDMVSYGPN